MRDTQKEIFGIAAILGLSADSVNQLNRLCPSWKEDLRETCEELAVDDEVELELRLLAVEALEEFAQWEAKR